MIYFNFYTATFSGKLFSASEFKTWNEQFPNDIIMISYAVKKYPGKLIKKDKIP